MTGLADAPCAFVFNNTAPRGRSYRDHLIGDEGANPAVEDGKRPGFGHYLLWLADQVKGMRAVVIHPRIAFLLTFACKVELAPAAYGRPAGTWRGHPVYLDSTLYDGSGYLSDRCDGARLATFQVVNL